MKIKRTKLLAISSLMLLLIATPSFSPAQELIKKTIEKSIDSWLLLGPFPAPMPAFYNDGKKDFSLEDQLKFDEAYISHLKPKAKNSFKWHDGTRAQWNTIHTEEENIKLEGNGSHPSTAYLGVYIDVSRWTNASVILRSPQMFRLYLDGRSITSKDTVEKAEEGKATTSGKKTTVKIRLVTGKHLLLIKTVFDPRSNSDWTIRASVSYDEKFASSNPSITLLPEKKMTIGLLLDGPKLRDISISPDGTLAALSKRQTLPPSDTSESWLELYDIEANRLIQTYRGDMAISSVRWAPNGKKFSYTSYGKSRNSIWIVDLEAGASFPFLKDIKNLEQHVWAPDGSFIIYSVSEEGRPDRKGVKRLQDMADRQPGWRNRSFLYKISVPGGVRQRLTAGELSTSLNSISPDGKSLVFTRSTVDYSVRPFSKTELYSLNLETLKAEMLWEGRWFQGAQWGPKGKKLLLLGGPSMFGDAGINVPSNTLPNEYDNQAYLFNPLTKEVEPITKFFNPSINQAFWSQTEDNIYFTATDRSYRFLFMYDLKKKIFSPINCGAEIVDHFDLASKKPIAVFSGSRATVPPKAYVLNIKKMKTHLLQDPGKEDFKDVRFGRVKRWVFKSNTGHEILGRIYYPPNFDQSKQYPCIVYYYGGTSPVTRDFGGRYPKNLWAAPGYVVYVLQPSGATGFGQKFSALHVNDWGLIVADEIILGVKKFLDAHPFIDPKRVGCIGASYGGFMTMLLLTRTNMFSAAVSHAGISSISSYWGEGYWGYSYSAYATANSFPWNRRDIYVNQSALFNADKITTPLLLLHGSVDTNVPPGESTQLYTALKILGREVEYIQVLDQNHHILTYNKRKIWTKTILAWFDRCLKHQPEWWHYLYPNR